MDSYADKLGKVGELAMDFKKLEDTVLVDNELETFYFDFMNFVNNQSLTDAEFNEKLTEFLFTTGMRYQNLFKFEEKLKCGDPAPKIKLMTMKYKHKS